ncbi:hypothetical protein STCU_01464 [Strigomonas culicis]|uniref:Right handed beta helix domain-containing protein n=1 Tax=Strigomonas culicis TaxID=28005 RepID=S9V0W7_9TRYP|nr:hypothetical protein STCU_01464 [Strigomonas culicis]|eukprot:EPY34638.1 hypothetical protein STCU_01464 [Strigomonas culicis]
MSRLGLTFSASPRRAALARLSLGSLQVQRQTFSRSTVLRESIKEEEVEELRNKVRYLTEELDAQKALIRRLVSLIDVNQHQRELDSMKLNLEGGGGFFIVPDDASLVEALQTPGARVVLQANRVYNLSYVMRIRKTHVTIIGNGATIVGSFALTQGSLLSASDVTFVARQKEIASSLPVFDVTVNSKLYLTNCTLINGRDGVYLGIRSTAKLTGCHVISCVRGVYEGVGCRAACEKCEMAENFFGLVLLGPDKEQRCRAYMSEVAFQRLADRDAAVLPPGLDEPLWLREGTGRADVALEHDPMSDVYTSCFKNGEPVVLSAAEATAGLSDPVY